MSFFQKAIKYRRLADGLDVLKSEDAIYDKLVTGILSRQSSVRSRDTIEEILDAFVEEVENYVDIVDQESDAFDKLVNKSDTQEDEEVV